MSDPQDLSAFAGEIDKLARGGNFDPFSLLAGESRFHSVFLAPFSPSLKDAIARFLADGTGPLVEVVKSFQQQGVAAAEAQQQARQMFSAAQGMLVVVMAGDHGLATIPQLNFGHLEEAYCEHALKACGERFPGKEGLAAALADLRAKARGGTAWPALIAGPDAGGNLLGYWLDIGVRLVEGLEEGLAPAAGGIERLRDLAHWVGAAVTATGRELDEDAAVIVARCHLVAGESQAGAARLDRLLGEDADSDALAELAAHLADAAVKQGHPQTAAAWLEHFVPRFEAFFGTCYELRLAALKLLAAAAAPGEALLAAAARLFAANRKSARQDLTREPIWRVAVADPGPLLETAAAAELIGRSPAFLAKRLEQGTIPFYRLAVAGHSDQLRLPERALRAWKAVMDAHQLLD